MENKIKPSMILLLLVCSTSSAIACDYEYSTDDGSTICANSADKEVTITTENGDEHSGEWGDNGVVQDSETGEQLTVSN